MFRGRQDRHLSSALSDGAFSGIQNHSNIFKDPGHCSKHQGTSKRPESANATASKAKDFKDTRNGSI